MQYSKELLQQQYKDGLISYKVLLYFDIVEKIESLQDMKKSNKVKVVAAGLGCSKDKVYRALRMFS